MIGDVVFCLKSYYIFYLIKFEDNGYEIEIYRGL